MDINWGVDVNKVTNSKYIIAYSLDRAGICIFKDENLYSSYSSGPYKDKEEAGTFLETLEAIDNA